ncbi:MAG: hypothetical protein JNL21_06775 [Myxococcales bacterium]|nr:hypothetical protein [Myxococcales bacterium]
MEQGAFSLTPPVDRDAVDDAIAALELRLCAVLPDGAGLQIVAVSPDRRTKATFVSSTLPLFDRVLLEGARAVELASRLETIVSGGPS